MESSLRPVVQPVVEPSESLNAVKNFVIDIGLRVSSGVDAIKRAAKAVFVRFDGTFGALYSPQPGMTADSLAREKEKKKASNPLDALSELRQRQNQLAALDPNLGPARVSSASLADTLEATREAVQKTQENNGADPAKGIEAMEIFLSTLAHGLGPAVMEEAMKKSVEEAGNSPDADSKRRPGSSRDRRNDAGPRMV
jgi:hypothetical protein